MKLVLITLISLFGLSFLGCQSESTPETVLDKYVKARFSGGMDKDDVLGYLEGPFYDFVEEMDEEEFANFIDLKNLKLNFIKILDKRCDIGKCYVTYLIDYSLMNESQSGNKKTDFQTQVKKVAEITGSEKNWKISKIDNLKTLHLAKEPINISN